MSWKTFVSVLFLLIVVVLLGLYWFFPLSEIEFKIAFPNTIPGNTNFSINQTGNNTMQFYSNLRYKTEDISYRIDRCPLNKVDEMKRAFETIENLTILDFYSVPTNEEISVTCDSGTKYNGELFIAGEGGPVNITKADFFNVIHQGSVLIIRESKCANPNIGIHELLHALGFAHSSNPGNIMYEVSNCNQKIGEDTINLINELYSFPSHPDLLFEDASASMKGRYLDLAFTVRNNGLQNSPNATIKVYADGDEVKDFILQEIPIGAGRIVTLKNILVLQTRVSEIELLIDSNFPELKKDNNRILLGITS